MEVAGKGSSSCDLEVSDWRDVESQTVGDRDRGDIINREGQVGQHFLQPFASQQTSPRGELIHQLSGVPVPWPDVVGNPAVVRFWQH